MSSRRRQANEIFRFQNTKLANICDFWSWAYSDLQSNIIRAILAEYLVALALGITEGVREEWNPYDLLFGNIRVEVKTAAYIQSWQQNQLSRPVFSIAPAISLGDGVSGADKEIKRRSDVYVFCLHACKDRANCDPMDLEQWDFFCVPTKYFDTNMEKQKKITIAKLEKIAIPVKFSGLKAKIINTVL